MPNTKHNVRLTSAEIAVLWSGYIGDSMSRCVLGYFLNRVEDTEIRPVLDYAYGLTKQHLRTLSKLFASERFPIPHGFTDEDVNVNARRLFSDSFYLNYLKVTAKQGLSLYGFALSQSVRADVRAYFAECLASTTKLFNRTVDVMLEKGLLVRPPYIPQPEQPELVKKESFLNGLFGDKRPLTTAEIGNLHANIETNALGKALIIGFAQTAQSAEVKRYFVRGKDIAHKQLEVFSRLMREEDLPSPMSWDSDVLDSTEPPFSDKLMLQHIVGINAAGVSNYGTALSQTMRRDIAAMYVRLLTEIGTYGDDGAELLIKSGWMEKMPGAVDREALVSR